jgi:hypothetical protein
MSTHQSFERSLTSAERQRLLDLIPLPNRPPFPIVRLVRRVFEMLCVLLAGCLLVAVKDVNAFIVFPGIAVIYLLYWEFDLMDLLVLRRQRYAFEYHAVMEFRNAVNAASSVRVHRFETDTVVQVLSDDQTSYLIDAGTDQTYWLDIGYRTGLIPGNAPADWPNTKFEILELPNYPKQIGPLCSGKKLRPRESYEMDELIPQGLSFEDAMSADGIINMPLDSFLAELKTQKREAAKSARSAPAGT